MPAPDSRKVMDVVSSEKNLMKTRRWISHTRFFTQCRFLEPMAWHHIRTWMFSVSWRRLGNTRQDLIQPLWSSIVRSGVLVLPDLSLDTNWADVSKDSTLRSSDGLCLITEATNGDTVRQPAVELFFRRTAIVSTDWFPASYCGCKTSAVLGQHSSCLADNVCISRVSDATSRHKKQRVFHQLEDLELTRMFQKCYK